MNFTKFWQTSLVLLLGLGITVSSGGCSGKSGSGKTDSDKKKDDHEHGHAEKGTRGGHIVEFGADHKYHGEVVESHDAESITIYILDGNMKDLLVKADKITANMMVNNELKTFELKAANLTDGKASKFDGPKEFFEAIEHNEKAKVDISINIDGTPYSTSFTHEDLEGKGHDHKGHKH